MLAVDTNVVVRYLVGDDAVQSPVARRLIDQNPIRVLPTVLLETEWVVRSRYAYSRERIHAGLAAFIGLHTVSVEHTERIATALDDYANGMDFADALHMAYSSDCAAFATFDRKMAAAAKKAGAGKIKVL
jgi:predicted nucleic-acid-binding protein